MLTYAERVTLLGVGQWSIKGEDVVRKDGSPAQYAVLQFPDEDNTRKISIGADCEVPETGNEYIVGLKVTQEVKAVRGATPAQDYTRTRDKFSVVEFRTPPVKRPAEKG